MIRSQLSSYSGSDPIWGFVALVGTERFSGETAVGIDPRVRLFAVDGRVYFAEREGDAPIGALLVGAGSVTSAQLEQGSVKIGDTSSLARLFQRDPTIDRDAAELTIALATESLLASIASKPVGLPEVFPLRHHPSGVHHWLRAQAGSLVEEAPLLNDVTPVPEQEWTASAAIEESVPVELVADSLPTLDPVCALLAMTAPWVEPHTLANGANGHAPHTTIDTVTEEQLPVPSMPTLPSLTAVAPGQKPLADGISVAPDPGTVDLLPEPMSPWSGATHNLAAVNIWEMVDDLTTVGQPEVPQLVSGGAPGKRGRRWLRSRKE